jgi:hypothetical protein
MFKFLRVPPSFIDRLDKAPIPINDYRVVQRVDDMPSLVRMIANYHQITTWQAEVAVLNYYGRTHDGPQIFENHTTVDEPTNCRQAVHRIFKSWLSEFAWDANSKSPSHLANQMAMSHFGTPGGTEEANDYEDLWLDTHRRLYDRAMIKILKNAKKWSVVRKILVANKDRHGQTIYDEEWHPAVLASLALYEKRPARKRKAKAT